MFEIDYCLEKEAGRTSVVMPSVIKRASSLLGVSSADAQKILSSKMLLDEDESTNILHDILKRYDNEPSGEIEIGESERW